ncbi:hypothetical protein HMPREF9318_01573 [Streptococcus urinalis FB127-CNA-2]|uniref:Uncharacterized protein n=1 Tax=Streptococcus urinalis 2285-97 TaxID=764291 RepID=G5KFK8_9STRE|nr:hypothetical protein STRUR_2275 [Streptococcus urinalis 2285-97]EKS19177.1 hypothetical protein HMPREF9318_01573 [Streptococcus urinalis FB127-CNA-2]QBX12169.1 hypothetical protein JavanS644_0005 [Streptococcus satellite phage Javan644]QBX12197.1 hypothetical protein JavanS647_0005 [Streptococcus satellite phage Javan647]QBX12214.1 hypothetical protein JavanS649_0009 [Streptococcus satellite phage Javan649]VEF33101.1 replication protein [Streptococcus urinalis]
MSIYESKGFTSSLFKYKGSLEPFEYIAQFKPLKPPENGNIEHYKEHEAPYIISGTIKPENNGSYKRNNKSLISRDLIFLDYDDLEIGINFPKIVSKRLSEYSYIIYPTIKHTADNPRYRLVVKPNMSMNENSYKTTVKEIADLIGLPFDESSLTWSQLQGGYQSEEISSSIMVKTIQLLLIDQNRIILRHLLAIKSRIKNQ